MARYERLGITFPLPARPKAVTVSTWLVLSGGFVALLAGCSRVIRHTTSQETHATATVESHATATEQAAQREAVRETRIVRGGRTVIPRADGGWDVSWYYDYAGQQVSEADATAHKEADVKSKATDTTSKKTDDKKVSGRPLWHWFVLAVVVCVILWGAVKAWRLKRRVT